MFTGAVVEAWWIIFVGVSGDVDVGRVISVWFGLGVDRTRES